MVTYSTDVVLVSGMAGTEGRMGVCMQCGLKRFQAGNWPLAWTLSASAILHCLTLLLRTSIYCYQHAFLLPYLGTDTSTGQVGQFPHLY